MIKITHTNTKLLTERVPPQSCFTWSNSFTTRNLANLLKTLLLSLGTSSLRFRPPLSTSTPIQYPKPAGSPAAMPRTSTRHNSNNMRSTDRRELRAYEPCNANTIDNAFHHTLQSPSTHGEHGSLKYKLATTGFIQVVPICSISSYAHLTKHAHTKPR